MYSQNELSVFYIDEAHPDKAWKDIQSQCKLLTDWGSNILQGGLNGSLGTILLERHYICKDYKNLYSNFYSKKFIDRQGGCSRLHFFSGVPASVEDILYKSSEIADRYLVTFPPPGIPVKSS